MMDLQQDVIDQTKHWIHDFVIGWNMCPFARLMFESERIRYAVSETDEPEVLLGDFVRELRTLHESDIAQIETSFLIHPFALTDFYIYNDFLHVFEAAREDQDLDGVIQIASFHPHYHFAGTHPVAIENFTNRSPYPMLHLLREESVARAVTDYPDIEKIPERNMQTMRERGVPEVKPKPRIDGSGNR
ncbi:MAG: DUF1415 domain-containing protein [Gemmatimonadota bacterium]|nr:DUF1415 domain-containing protein [Gemmatimonadota bacterium]